MALLDVIILRNFPLPKIMSLYLINKVLNHFHSSLLNILYKNHKNNVSKKVKFIQLLRQIFYYQNHH